MSTSRLQFLKTLLCAPLAARALVRGAPVSPPVQALAYPGETVWPRSMVDRHSGRDCLARLNASVEWTSPNAADFTHYRLYRRAPSS